MNPILDVLRREGRPLTIEQLDRHVITEMKLAPDVAAIPHDAEKPDRSEVGYRIVWSRTYLKKAGLLDNPTRGQWGASEKGRSAGAIDAYELASEIVQASKAASVARAAAGESSESDADGEGEEDEELLAARVGDELARQIRSTHEQLAADGQLLSADQAARCCGRFRDLFGPDVLGGLDGEALLTKMHGRGTKDSLVYWLEFKDDDEFPCGGQILVRQSRSPSSNGGGAHRRAEARRPGHGSAVGRRARAARRDRATCEVGPRYNRRHTGGAGAADAAPQAR
jgi:hypothetical protein